MGWSEDKDKLVGAGFTQPQITQAASLIADNMNGQGMGADDFTEYFGKPAEPDPSDAMNAINQSLKRNLPPTTPAEGVNGDTLSNALKGAYQNSILGMGLRHQMPTDGIEKPSVMDDGSTKNTVLKTAQGLGTALLDTPFMAAAGIGALFTAGPEAVVPAAMGVPAGIREAFAQSIKKGGIHSAKDFFDMADNAQMATIKGAITGEFVGMAGAGATTAIGAAAGTTAAGIADVAGQTIASPIVSGALDKRMPEPQEFLDSAVQMGGLHLLTHSLGGKVDPETNPINDKLLNIYRETGIHPKDVATAALNDPSIQQHMVSQNTDVPPQFQNARQPQIKSDFVLSKDGSKLIPGDQAEAQAEFPFQRTSISKMVEDHDSRNTPEKQLQAAKLHDPEAFQQLEAQSKIVNSGIESVKQNKIRIDALKEHESNVKELADIRQKLSDPEKYGVSDIEAHKALTDREAELQKTEAKDSKRAELAQNLRDENSQLMEQMAKTRDNEPLKKRLSAAWEKGRNTIRDNLNDRIRNSSIELEGHGEDGLNSSKPFDQLNPDFMAKDEHAPMMTEEAKIELMDHDNRELFYDGDKTLSQDQQMAIIMKDHPELAAKMTPDLVGEIPAPTNDAGEATAEPEKYVYASRPKKDPFQKIKDRFKRLGSLNNIVEDYYNNLINLKNASKGIPLVKNPFETMLHSRGSEQRGLVALGKFGLEDNSAYGIYSPSTGEKLAPSLFGSLEQNGITKDNLADFKQYVIFKHGLDENAKNNAASLEEGATAKNVKTGVDDAQARAFVDKHQEEFGAAQRAFSDWHNALLQQAVDGNLMTQATKDGLVSKYPNYAPFNRLNEDGSSKGGAMKRKAFYAREGSDLSFLDPIQSSMEKALNLSRHIEENQARLQAISKGGLPRELLKDVRRPETLAANEAAGLKSDPTFTKPYKETLPLADNQVGFMDKGEYHVASFEDPALAKTLKDMKFDSGITGILGDLFDTAKAYTGMRRGAAIANPAFLERHVLRATQFSFLMGANPLSLIKSIGYWKEAAEKQSPLYVDALRSKALDGSDGGIGHVMGDKEIIPAPVDDSSGAYSTLRNVVKSPFVLIGKMTSLVHSAISIGQNAAALSIFSDKLAKLGENPTMLDKMQAGLETNKTILNGLQTGSAIQGLNAITAFMHYSVQGFGKGIEAAKENPGRLATAGSLLTGAALLGYNSVKDDKRYQDMPAYLKNSAVWFKIHDTLVPVPVPWELGHLFCTVPRMIAEHAYMKDQGGGPDWKAVQDGVASLIPLKMPTAVEDFRSIHDNYNSLTGKATVPDSMLSLAPRAQVQPWTSNTAYAVSKMASYIPGGDMGMHLKSPIMVDHIIQNMIGSGGSDALKVLETSLQSAGLKMPVDKSWEQLAIDQPFIRGVIGSQPTYNAEPLNQWKDKFNEVKSMQDSYNKLKKSDPDAAEEYYNEHPQLEDYRSYSRANQALKKANIAIQAVNLDKSQSPSDKKQNTEQMYRDAIDIARQQVADFNKSEGEKR
jgi:hypothetical protein